MSDEKQAAAPIVQIPVDELSEFMNAKGITRSCHACGQDAGWSNYYSEYGVTSIPVCRDGDILIGGGTVEVLTLRCQNCGYIRMFDMSAYKDWKRENGTN